MFPVSLINEKATQQSLAYLVIGGHALNYYCEPRATLDVDFLVRVEDKSKWTELLHGEGFKSHRDGKNFLQFSPPYGVPWRVDLMLVNSATFDTLAADASAVELLGIKTRIPSREHLVALKLHTLKHGPAERFDKDFGDVIALLRSARTDVRSEAFRSLATQFGTVDLYDRIIQRLG